MNTCPATLASSCAEKPSARLTKKLSLLFLCLLACTAGTARAQEPQTADATSASRPAVSTGSGTITGRVTGEDGRPLAYAVVSVFKPFSAGTGQQQQSLGTDEDGKFLATNLSPGLYSVSAYAPGLISQPDATTGSGEPRYYRVGESVSLTLVKGGVITGTVRDASGEPVVAVAVKALRVRDLNGHSFNYNFGYAQARLTDDRGVYRIYGLTPGTYLVSAGGGVRFSPGVSAYEGDIPTYYPSSTRDTATEVPVRGGEEATGIDIRYRGERGHTISGSIIGTPSTQGLSYGISLMLKQASSGGYESMNFVAPTARPVFSIQGVGDGVYDLLAHQASATGDTSASTPRRITVKGADVTGVELALAPLGSIAGRAILEPAPKKEGCEAETRPATLNETLVNARRAERGPADSKNPAESLQFSPFYTGSGAAVSDQGEFTLRNLSAGSYRLTARLPVDFWYIRSLAMPGSTTNTTTTARAAQSVSKAAEPKGAGGGAAVPSLINLRAGESFAGVTVSIAQGGAAVSGRIINAKEGADGAVLIPENLKIYLVPAERERAEDLLRYAEVKPGTDGAFRFTNLAPGRYWLVARPFVEDESPERLIRPLAWDADARAKLRREAEAQNTTVELQPCKSAADQLLRYTVK